MSTSSLSLTQPRRKGAVFPEERKDLEGKTPSLWLLSGLFASRLRMHAKERESAQGAGALQTEKDTGMARWQDISSRKLALQKTISYVLPSCLFSASKFPRSSDVTVPTVSE